MPSAFITRHLPPDSAFRTALEAAGWQVEGQSLVQLEALPFEVPQGVDWIFFSSKNAVAFFFEAYPAPENTKTQKHENTKTPLWAALGPATAAALADRVQRVDFIGDGDPVRSAEAFLPLAMGQTVLFPAAKHSMESVPQQLEGRVRSLLLPVYDNYPVETPEPRAADVLVFTSPMNTKAYFQTNALRYGQRLVAIGDSTARALAGLGYPDVTVATAPDEMALAQSVLFF